MDNKKVLVLTNKNNSVFCQAIVEKLMSLDSTLAIDAVVYNKSNELLTNNNYNYIFNMSSNNIDCIDLLIRQAIGNGVPVINTPVETALVNSKSSFYNMYKNKFIITPIYFDEQDIIYPCIAKCITENNDNLITIINSEEEKDAFKDKISKMYDSSVEEQNINYQIIYQQTTNMQLFKVVRAVVIGGKAVSAEQIDAELKSGTITNLQSDIKISQYQLNDKEKWYCERIASELKLNYIEIDFSFDELGNLIFVNDINCSATLKGNTEIDVQQKYAEYLNDLINPKIVEYEDKEDVDNN